MMRGINHGEDFGWGAVAFFGPSQGTQTVQQQATNAPWSVQQPFLSNMFNAAQDLYSNQAGWPQYFPGNTYQPLDPTTNAAIGNVQSFGMQGGAPSMSAAQGTLGNIESQGTSTTAPAFAQAGDWMSNTLKASADPTQDPGFQQVMSNTIAKALPAATAGFIGGGRADSGLASAAAGQGVTQALGNLTLGQYNTNRQLQEQVANVASQTGLGQEQVLGQLATTTGALSQDQLNSLQSAVAAGQITQQDANNQIQAAISKWNYNQTLPWNMLGLFQNTVGGTGYGGTSTGTTQQPYYTNVGANLLGAGEGALATAALAKQVFPDTFKAVTSFF